MKQVGIAALALCLTYGTPAWAQSGSPTPSPATNGSTPADQSEIVVTAQHRSEKLEDVPIAIISETGKQLQTAGVTRLEDLGKIAPGVVISRTGIYNQPAIRGVTTQLVGPGAENNVAVYVDGFYRPFQTGLNFDFTNVSQINVLKGPQGTLFGRNATGGAILIDTIKPSLTKAAADMGVSYARFNDFRAWANVSTPVTRNLAIGVNGYFRRSDGYIKDDSGFNTAPVRNHSVTGTAVWMPADHLKITGSIETTRISDGLGLAATFTGHSIVAAYVPGTNIEMGRNRTSLNHPIVNDVHLFAQYLKGEYDVGPVKITSLTSWSKETTVTSYDIDGSPVYFYDQHLKEFDHAFTQEVDVASNTSGRLSYVVGAFYINSRAQTASNFLRQFPSTVFVAGTNIFSGSRSAAVFADATYEIVDNLFVTGGVRYSWEKKHALDTAANGSVLGDVTNTFNSVTPRAVVRYQLSPRSNVYASFSKGFKSGAVNFITPFTEVRPEKLTAYEIGYKTVAGRIHLDLDGYYYQYTDLQNSKLVQTDLGQQVEIYNAAAARIYGVEAQFSGSVTPALNLRLGGAYNHARYTNFTNVPITPVNPATGLNSSTCTNPNAPPATIACTQNLSDTQMLRAPTWSGTLGGDYRVPLSSGGLVLSANLSATSGYAPTNPERLPNGGPRYYQKGFALLGLQAEWDLPGDHLRVAVYGNNVTDTQYYIVKTGNAFGDYGVQGEPATYGVRLSYRF